MGWASGSRLAAVIWDIVGPLAADEQQLHDLALKVCKAFKDEDCDTLDEAESLYEAAYPWAVVEGQGDDAVIDEVFATRQEAEQAAQERIDYDKANGGDGLNAEVHYLLSLSRSSGNGE